MGEFEKASEAEFLSELRAANPVGGKLLDAHSEKVALAAKLRRLRQEKGLSASCLAVAAWFREDEIAQLEAPLGRMPSQMLIARYLQASDAN